MKKVVSLVLVFVMLAAMFTVSFSASYSVTEPEIISYEEAIANYEAVNGPLETQRLYFQMPDGNRGGTADDDVYVHYPETVDAETGETIEAHDELFIAAGNKAPSWYNDFNIVDGNHIAGVYWYGGPAQCEDSAYGGAGWVGYKMGIVDYNQGIFCVDIPVATKAVIFNNGVNGGMDPKEPIYYEAAQTRDINTEGAYEGDYDSLTYGSPDPDLFDGCIYVIDPNQVDVNPLTNKQSCGGNWYVYYGDGCYGEEFAEGFGDTDYEDGTPGWTGDIADVCMNPDHFVDGVHVGYHEDAEPTEAPATEAPATEAPATEAPATEAPATEAPAYTPDPNKLYFDTNGTGWEMGAKDKVGFYVFSTAEGAEIDWGGKKLLGSKVDGTDTIWEYDPAAKGMTLNDGVQYKIIFYHAVNSAATEQTYDLFFDTTCLGDCGYCNGTEYENPVDSSKTAMAAFWKGKDASEFGPVLQISSIGNVVGTCLEEGKTKLDVFTDFISVVSADSGKTGLDNSREYVVKPGTKTEQQLIDDLGSDLGLTADEVQSAFTTTGVETTWNYDDSTLPKQAPATEAPATEAPATEAPATEAPATEAPATEAPATEAPATEAPTEESNRNIYCLTGTIANWGFNLDFKLTKLDDGSYVYRNLALTPGDSVKAVFSKKGDGISAWYPDGMDNDQKVAENGYYDVYFRPDGDGTAEDGWNYIYYVGDGSGDDQNHGCTRGGYMFKFVKVGDYTPTEPPAPLETVTVYFTDSIGWSGVKAYYWGGESATPGWPGIEIEQVGEDEGKPIYKAVIPADVEGLIFNGSLDGNSVQTANIESGIEEGATWTLTGDKEQNVYSVEEIETPVLPVEMITVYFTDVLGWGDINAYFWGSDETSVDWPGNAATFEKVDLDGHSVYSAVVPADIDGLIFNGNGSQTVNIEEGFVNGAAWRTTGEKDGNNFVVETGFCTYMLGDADDNGAVEVIDATWVQRYDALYNIGDVAATIMQADVDGSGEVDIIDATYIQRYLVEMPVKYPIGEVIVAA